MYSVSDSIFALHCSTPRKSGRLGASKPGLRNKRHVNHRGTCIYLFRARAVSLAEDWFLGLHIALGKDRLSTLEVHSPQLGFRIRLPTDATAHDSASASVAVSATRNLMTAGLPDHNLVSKEEILQSCTGLLATRDDWKDLIDLMQREGLRLALAWRKGKIVNWLTTDRSIDGVHRIWDVYTGAIMQQPSQTTKYRLEVSKAASCLLNAKGPLTPFFLPAPPRSPLPFVRDCWSQQA